MRHRWRWAVVAVATALLAAVPPALHLAPIGHSSISARTLLARIQASASVGYSGFAQSTGGLALPVTADQFSTVNDLFGGQTQLRVWWRGASDWRVDAIDLTGETDVHQDSRGTWTWDYESNTARRTTPSSQGAPAARLPRSDDLAPANLARRLLSEADPADVTRLPDARIAGHAAAGLRLHVATGHSTVTRVDVWALPSNGLPVRAAVYAAAKTPIVSATMLDLTTGRPSPATTVFDGAHGEKVENGQFDDIVSVIDQFGRSTPPDQLAGLPRRTDLNLGAVGVYGRGVDLLVAVPLSAHLAGDVVPQLRRTPGVVENTLGISLGVGPLNLQLSPPAGFGARWMLIGTLTRSTLTAAVRALPPAQGFGFEFNQ